MINSTVLVKRVEDNEQEGGIKYAQALDSFIYKGEVVDTPERIPVPQDAAKDSYWVREAKDEVQVGDIIIFEKHAGDEVMIEGQTYKVLSEHDIKGIVSRTMKELVIPVYSTGTLSPIVKPNFIDGQPE